MDPERYPTNIAKLLFELERTNGPPAVHKLLLDLGEAFLTHITGIMFGEYKRYWGIDEPLEAEYYRNAKKKPSFGIFLNLKRKLIKAQGQSILDEYFERGREYNAVSDFVFNYELLKGEVVNKGQDSGFSGEMEPLRKGRTVAKKSVLQFFETFIAVRNTFAHPEEKAKNPLRSWPLGDEYYLLVNPLMKAALYELLAEMQVLISYQIALAEELDKQKRKGVFHLEVGLKGYKLEQELSEENLEIVVLGSRYVLNTKNDIYCKYYRPDIPHVDKSVAPRIIEQEKAKMMEPVLREMIGQKLDDGVIDDLEYLVLKETAFSSFIPEERLKSLVEAVKTKLGIDGDVYVESKDSNFRPVFNPHWFEHFSRLEDPTVERSDDCLNQSNLHKNVWLQLSDYLQYLVENHLNNEEASWQIKSNKYQQGRLSFKYWGQVYPDHSPLRHGFNVGFIVGKKFNWVKAKKNNPLRYELDQPCMLLYTTAHNEYIKKIDPEGELEREYGRINYRLLLREREALEKMGGFTNALQYRTRDIHSFEDYFREKSDNPEDEALWIYSKIWNCDDFMKDGMFHQERVYRIEKEIIAYLTLFSHSVLKINDYYIARGGDDE